VLVLLVVLLATASAGAALGQGRDVRPAAPVGRAVIEGMVVGDGPSASPEGRAHVTLTAPELLGGRIIITDQTGLFRFTGLPAGHYSLSVTKPAYLTTKYGATRPGGEGTTIILKDADRFSNLRLTLVRGGVITGRVSDEHGRPAPQAIIAVMRYRYTAGERRLIGGFTTSADLDGRYRVFGLLPGSYVVRVLPFAGGSVLTNAPGEVDAAMRSGSLPPLQVVSSIGYSHIYISRNTGAE
jgi:protocatechuate 3,4-dioxygenase beta subunit